MPAELPDDVVISNTEIPLVQHLRELANRLTQSTYKFDMYTVARSQLRAERDAVAKPVVNAIFSFAPARASQPGNPLATVSVAFNLECEMIDGPARVKIPSLDHSSEGITVKRTLSDGTDEICHLDQLPELEAGSVVWVNTRLSNTKDEVYVKLTKEDLAVIKPAIAKMYPSAIDEIFGPDEGLDEGPAAPTRPTGPNGRGGPSRGDRFPPMGM